MITVETQFARHLNFLFFPALHATVRCFNRMILCGFQKTKRGSCSRTIIDQL